MFNGQFALTVGSLISIAAISGCATGKAVSSSGESAGKRADGAIELEFKGKAGEKSETRYFSNSRSQTFEEGQILRDREEGVDFTVLTQVDDYDDKQKILKYRSTTVRKNGIVPLHDLAFPELKEEVDYIQRGTGEILKAGGFSPQGIFYVPSLPMPRGPVKVGDTWAMKHVWFSAQEGIPLELEVIGILKDIVKCEKSLCADIELSGGVGLAVAPTAMGAKFQSRLWGRLLFSLDRGDVIWSEMRSQEEMSVNKQRTLVTSCMVSETKIYADYKTAFKCETSDQAVQSVPKI